MCLLILLQDIIIVSLWWSYNAKGFTWWNLITNLLWFLSRFIKWSKLNLTLKWRYYALTIEGNIYLIEWKPICPINIFFSSITSSCVVVKVLSNYLVMMLHCFPSQRCLGVLVLLIFPYNKETICHYGCNILEKKLLSVSLKVLKLLNQFNMGSVYFNLFHH